MLSLPFIPTAFPILGIHLDGGNVIYDKRFLTNHIVGRTGKHKLNTINRVIKNQKYVYIRVIYCVGVCILCSDPGVHVKKRKKIGKS